MIILEFLVMIRDSLCQCSFWTAKAHIHLPPTQIIIIEVEMPYIFRCSEVGTFNIHIICCHWYSYSFLAPGGVYKTKPLGCNTILIIHYYTIYCHLHLTFILDEMKMSKLTVCLYYDMFILDEMKMSKLTICLYYDMFIIILDEMKMSKLTICLYYDMFILDEMKMSKLTICLYDIFILCLFRSCFPHKAYLELKTNVLLQCCIKTGLYMSRSGLGSLFYLCLGDVILRWYNPDLNNSTWSRQNTQLLTTIFCNNSLIVYRYHLILTIITIELHSKIYVCC